MTRATSLAMAACLASSVVLAASCSSARSGPAPAIVPGSVTVSRDMPTGRLGPGFVGFSFEKSHLSDAFFTGTNAPLIALHRLLGAGLVRIGANDVDRSVWQPTAGLVAGGTTINQVGTVAVDALADFLAATGWRAIYGVNMKTSTPDAAVAEATYVAGRLGDRLAALEIGNEINLYPGGYAQIRAQWEVFASALHAALPDLPLAAPATTGDIAFANMFARDEAAAVTMLTHHYYRGNVAAGTASIANLLAADPSVAHQSRALAAAANTYALGDGFRWDEMNSYAGHGAAGVSDTFAAALWSIDFMLTTAALGAGGVNFHGGGQNMDGNVCPSDVASCTRPFRYAPIVEVDSQVTAAAPLFYGMLFVAQLGTGALLPTRASNGWGLDFTAYAVATADGSTEVVLINKSATSTIDATIDLGAPVTAATAVFLQAPALDATTGVTLGGAEVTAAGTWAPLPAQDLPVDGVSLRVVVPPAAAALVRVR